MEPLAGSTRTRPKGVTRLVRLTETERKKYLCELYVHDSNVKPDFVGLGWLGERLIQPRTVEAYSHHWNDNQQLNSVSGNKD